MSASIPGNSQQGVGLFSMDDIYLIREQWDAQIINVRGWADARRCSPETIRKIGRRDTYRHIGAEADVVSHAERLEIRRNAVPVAKMGEPTEEELAKSLARMQGILDAQPPSRKEVDALIEEMKARPRTPPEGPLDEAPEPA